MEPGPKNKKPGRPRSLPGFDFTRAKWTQGAGGMTVICMRFRNFTGVPFIIAG
jgi:hypothetical protein